MGTLIKEKYNMKPLDQIAGYDVRPGIYEVNGATAIPGGVNFTVYSNNATSCELLLFHRKENVPYAVLKFPENYKIGKVYSMVVFGLDIHEFEYAFRVDGPYDPQKGLIFNKDAYLLDPYAKAVTGQSVWGAKNPENNIYKARVVDDEFDWGDYKQPMIPMEDLIVYELHVRGYTKTETSLSAIPGTFAALQEKLPYLKKLGVNAVELMPVFEFDEMKDSRQYEGETLLDYWGYNTVSFFAPNTSYSGKVEYNHEGNELKGMIREFHENGIEVILDVVFNHTAEGNEMGPFFSFKGFDNNIYYMLTPEGYYYNYSGCGNTLNCNHPIVQQMIVECLRYWVAAYRVDGFRFDLASILGRNEDGSPMNKPPLIQNLAFDPLLGTVKLIAEAWDAGGLYQVGSFPSWSRFAEWNGRYRDDIRGFLRGDDGMASIAVDRIMGSRDLYNPETRGTDASVNFLTCHDGFTMYDLYSYNEKHNEANGWNNTDGDNNNKSWNCGVEGETDQQEILNLRKKMMKNAFAVLMTSRGTPMFLAGDEFCNTQFGNNNAYCQDNMVSWLDWNLLQKNQDMFAFVQFMIQFRKEHEIIRRDTCASRTGFPFMSSHGIVPWNAEYESFAKLIGVMFAGLNEKSNKEDIVYLAVNSYWEPQKMQLPQLPSHLYWVKVVDTETESGLVEEENFPGTQPEICLQGRSVQILIAKEAV